MAVKGCRALYVHWETIDFRKEWSFTMKQEGSVHIHLIQINSHEIRLTKKRWVTVCGATDETCGCASVKATVVNWCFNRK